MNEIIMIEDLVDEINNVIEVSIDHGGDYGGAYCCYPEEHKEAVKKLADMLGLEYDVVRSDAYAEDDPRGISHYLLSKRKKKV